MKKRRCFICKEMGYDIKRPSINKIRYYLCIKDFCNREFEKFRNDQNYSTSKNDIINEDKRKFIKRTTTTNKFKMEKMGFKQISGKGTPTKQETLIKNYIYDNIGKKILNKRNLFLNLVNVDNIEFIDSISNKYDLTRTKTFNMIIELFKNQFN